MLDAEKKSHSLIISGKCWWCSVINPLYAMAFTNAYNADARGSIFTDIGNQIIINNIFISDKASEFTQPGPALDDFCNNMSYQHLLGWETRSHTSTTSDVVTRRPPSAALLDADDHLSSASDPGTETVMPSRVPLSFCFLITPVIDIAEPLIIQIVALLQSDHSSYYQDLKSDLGSLQKILALTRLAIQTCQYLPLGECLGRHINWEVEECSTLLQELLGKLKSYRNHLSSTRINFLWSQMLSSGIEEWLIPLRQKLSARQKLLGQCLMALKL